MVHLSPDSRLLASLVKQEQVYADQLYSVLNASRSSLAALIIYASSSPPQIAPGLKGIASALAGADDALGSYTVALADWLDRLRAVAKKEGEVATIGRDREILVSRLIKVTQKTKVSPQSLLHSTPDSSSIVSFPTFNAKATAAQTELQACEARLAEKEKELDHFRSQALHHGLAVRCEALAQCGRVWNEMGQRALSFLNDRQKPLKAPNGDAYDVGNHLDHDADSALSSIAPSQSASQIGVPGPSTSYHPARSYSLDIPPAHQMADTGIPGTSVTRPREESISSSSEFEQHLEVRENPRYQQRTTFHDLTSKARTFGRSSPIPRRGASSDIGPASRSSWTTQERERKASSFLGNLASLFRTSMVGKPILSGDGHWATRTNGHLRNVKTDLEDSDHDGRVRSSGFRGGKAVGDGPTTQPSFATSTLRSDDVSVRNRTASLSKASTFKSTDGYTPNKKRLRANSLTTFRGYSEPNGHPIRAASENISSIPGHSSIGSTIRNRSHTDKPNRLTDKFENAGFGGPPSKLELARAPISHPDYPSILIHHPPPLVGTSMTSPYEKRMSLPAGVGTMSLTVTEKKPLRSALRNTNRDGSVSPVPTSSSTATDGRGPTSSNIRAALRPSKFGPLVMPKPTSIIPPDIPSTILESPRQSLALDDESRKPVSSVNGPLGPTAPPRPSTPSSIHSDGSATSSSYETGIENFEEDEVPTPSRRSPVFPEKPLAMNVLDPTSLAKTVEVDKREYSFVMSGDTAKGAAPMRRKSVRLSSLPPEVFNRTPSREEHEIEILSPPAPKPTFESLVPGSSGGWSTRIPLSTANEPWQDSSSEEENYKAAKRALCSSAQARFNKESHVSGRRFS